MLSPQAETSPPPPLPYYDWSPPSSPYYDTSPPQPPASLLVVAAVLCFMLLFVVICSFCYTKRKGKRVRQHDLEGNSDPPPKSRGADQYGGPPQHGQPIIAPSSDVNVPTPAPRSLESETPQPQPASATPQPQPASETPQPQPASETPQPQPASETPQPQPSPGISFGQSLRTFSCDVLATATDGFSDSNLLGEGGFGYVYKGVLPDEPDPKPVAIKKLKPGSKQGDPEFEAEVKIIGRVHHRHLVSLVGYCMAETERMLVYDFVPNKTLEFHLHGNDRPTMDWPTRMKIAIGSAKGLAYLHEDCEDRIIHRDIKAANILLDDSFKAKLADFGLAKFFPDTDTHISTGVKGTFGYLDPEYLASRKLTDKSDVFSFGVVLLQLITGRKPIDNTQSSTDYPGLVERARPLLSQALENGNFDPLVDPRLQNYIPEEMTRMVACAAACVRHLARCRPRMGQVLRALEGNIALEDLNEGTTPGQNNEDLEKFWKQALESQEHGTTSGYVTTSSEFGQHSSTSSSGGQQNAQEMEMKNVKS